MRHLSIILFASLTMGCGSYVTQAQLNESLDEVRSSAADVAAERSLAVHECAQTREFAQGAGEFCQMVRGMGGNEGHPACAISATWLDYCTPLNDEETDMVSPRPGVYRAISTIYEAANQEEGETEGTETSFFQGTPTSTPASN